MFTAPKVFSYNFFPNFSITSNVRQVILVAIAKQIRCSKFVARNSSYPKINSILSLKVTNLIQTASFDKTNQYFLKMNELDNCCQSVPGLPGNQQLDEMCTQLISHCFLNDNSDNIAVLSVNSGWTGPRRPKSYHPWVQSGK